jgi:hypothetical protein
MRVDVAILALDNCFSNRQVVQGELHLWRCHRLACFRAVFRMQELEAVYDKLSVSRREVHGIIRLVQQAKAHLVDMYLRHIPFFRPRRREHHLLGQTCFTDFRLLHWQEQRKPGSILNCP